MPRKKKPAPTYAALDCETDPFKSGRIPVPFAWGLRCRDSYRYWWGVGREIELIEALRELPEGCIVYAHNGGKFDFHFLTDYLDPDQPVFVINGRLGRGFIKDGPEIRDSFLLIPEALSAYQKTKIDYTWFEAGIRNRHKTTILNYLKDDCDDLFTLIGTFWDEHGPRLTLPQGSLKKWMDITGEKRPRSHYKFDAKFRPFYYGGRVQCFESGVINRPLRLYDINSAYPWAMLGNHPIGTRPLVSAILPVDPNELRLSFARIKARSGGCLPFRDELGRLEFPSDDVVRTYNATGHEILAGLETGTLDIKEVELCWTFQRSVSFRPFIMEYWKRRLVAKKNKDKLQDLLCKRTMNALYGKFATNPEKFREYRIAIDREAAEEFEDDGYKGGGFLGKWPLYIKAKSTEWGYLNVATSASITGEVRAHLFRALCSVKRPVYCDTDSIVCSSANDMALGKNLGEWDLESTATRGAFAGKKLYALWLRDGTTKTASKGVRLTADEIDTVARGGIVESLSEIPTFRVYDVPTFTTRRVRRTSEGQLWSIIQLKKNQFRS